MWCCWIFPGHDRVLPSPDAFGSAAWSLPLVPGRFLAENAGSECPRGHCMRLQGVLWYRNWGSYHGGTRQSRYWLMGRQAVSLEITQREMNGIYLLVLNGRLVLGDESSGLRTTVDNLLSSGVTRIVINLEHVNYVDSAGLGALIEAHRKTKAQGGRLKLCNLGPNFKRALELARLLPIFETCPSEAAAVTDF